MKFVERTPVSQITTIVRTSPSPGMARPTRRSARGWLKPSIAVKTKRTTTTVTTTGTSTRRPAVKWRRKRIVIEAGFYPRDPYNPAMSIRISPYVRASVLTAAALVLSPALSQVPAQKPEAPAAGFVARDTVSVTNLDVVVTDGKGNRVTGLKKEDFIVIEDNFEQLVTNFFAVEQGRITLPAEEATPAPVPAPGPAPAPAAGSAPRTRIVIFVDNLHLAPFDRNRVFRSVEPFVRENVKDNVEGMIVAWNRSLKIRRKFTNDGRDLSDVLRQLEDESALGQQIISDRRDVIQAIDDSTSPDQAAGRVRTYCESLDNDLTFTIDAMKTTINQLAGVEGRKILICVSDGLPQSPGAEVWKYISDRYRDSDRKS